LSVRANERLLCFESRESVLGCGIQTSRIASASIFLSHRYHNLVVNRLTDHPTLAVLGDERYIFSGQLRRTPSEPGLLVAGRHEHRKCDRKRKHQQCGASDQGQDHSPNPPQAPVLRADSPNRPVSVQPEQAQRATDHRYQRDS